MREYDFVGTVDLCENGIMHLTQRNYFTLSDELEILAPNREPISFKPTVMYNSDGEQIEVARHATEKLTIPSDITVPPHSILRKPVKK